MRANVSFRRAAQPIDTSFFFAHSLSERRRSLGGLASSFSIFFDMAATSSERTMALTGPTEDGVIEMGRLEIAQLENDRNFPERGSIEIEMGGGK